MKITKKAGSLASASVAVTAMVGALVGQVGAASAAPSGLTASSFNRNFTTMAQLKAITAKGKGPLQVRRHKGIINNGKEPALFGEPGAGRKVGYLQKRVGGCLQKKRLCLRADGISHCRQVGSVHKAVRNAEAGEKAGQQPVCAAVEVPAGQDVLSRFQQAKGRSDCSHP